MIDAQDSSPSREWAVQIGRFSMGVGGVEWATDMLLERSQGDASGSFYDRLTALEASLVNLQAGLQAELVNLIEEAHVLRELRNTVLHSTLAVDFYIRAVGSASDGTEVDTGRIFTTTQLKDRKGKNKDIDLSAMTDLAAQAEALSGRFWALLIKQSMP